jgi:hypothetical protein
MGIRNWLERSNDRIRSNGWDGFRDSLYELYEGLWRNIGWHVPRGTNIYDREWDTLVILDPCRVDLMREVHESHPFLGDVETFRSVGSMSEEWMRKTFTDEYAGEMNRTAYVTANVFSEEVLATEEFHTLDEVWRYAWDDETGTILPRPVTDRAIDVARTEQPDKLIVHYMQPHHPFVGNQQVDTVDADPFGRNEGRTAIDALRKGELSRAAFWEAYRSNLELVLDDVALLLENHDAGRVVITSDHGDALGEWGIYDHPAGSLHPVVTTVPWIETTASDTGNYEPEFEPGDPSETDVESRLRSLGYM